MIHSYLKPDSEYVGLLKNTSEHQHLKNIFEMQSKFNPAIVFRKSKSEHEITKRVINSYKNKNHRP
jgi:hypothetical protein